MTMRMLDLKLLRDLWRLRGQSLATAMVIAAGIALHVMASGALGSIDASRQAYYDRYRLADVFVTVKRAPLSVAAQVAAIPGVRAVMPRITGAAIVDVPGVAEPVNALVHSLPGAHGALLNMVHLVRGRLPERDDEALVSEAFTRKNGLTGGSHIFAILNGKRQALHIVGTALSPEHVFTIAPGNLVNDDRRYGVLWLNRTALEAAFDQRGAFNELLLRVDSGMPVAGIIAAVDRQMARHGGTGAYARADLLSDKFLRGEIDQLATIARLLPPMFLGVGAFLLWVMIGRVVESDRAEIGLLKAFGYRNSEIAGQYSRLVIAISLVGVALGCGLGAWLGHGLTSIYARFYQFPVLVFRIDIQSYATAVALTLAAALVGAWGPVRRAVALSPAVAMQPPAPTVYRSDGLAAMAQAEWLDAPSRMILRHLLRFRTRTLLSITGIALATGLSIVANFNMDAIGKLVDFIFNYAGRQDATVVLFEARSTNVLADLSHLPGVLHAEPFRSVPATLRHGQHQRREALTGIAPTAVLSRMVNDRWQPVTVPPHGVVLSDILAKTLDAVPGDQVTVDVLEGRRPSLSLRVVSVVRTYEGAPAWIDLSELNRLLLEPPSISGAYLRIDPARTDALYRAVKQRPMIAGISFRADVLHNFEQQVRDNMGTFRIYNVVLASIMVIGVVYNNARLSFSERARELATMRVLGYRRDEVAYVLGGELLVLVLASLLPGIGIGMALAWYVAQAFSSDIYTVPFFVSDATIGLALATTLLAALGATILVGRRLDRLDLVRALKSRE